MNRFDQLGRMSRIERHRVVSRMSRTEIESLLRVPDEDEHDRSRRSDMTTEELRQELLNQIDFNFKEATMNRSHRAVRAPRDAMRGAWDSLAAMNDTELERTVRAMSHAEIRAMLVWNDPNGEYEPEPRSLNSVEARTILLNDIDQWERFGEIESYGYYQSIMMLAPIAKDAGIWDDMSDLQKDDKLDRVYADEMIDQVKNAAKSQLDHYIQHRDKVALGDREPPMSQSELASVLIEQVKDSR